ncbi:MAG: sugar transferase [Ktedonobacterales bacterium]
MHEIHDIHTLRGVTERVGGGADAVAQGLLWRCGHRTLSEEDLRELRAAAGQISPAEWERLDVLAGEQGMHGLVLKHTAAAGLLPVMPERVSQSLLSAYRASWIRNRRLRGQQASIIQTLSARGIEVMPIKGVVLAERCYGELALRPITDLDLLVHRADVPAIGRILVGLGYQALPGEHDPQDFYGLVYHTVAYYGGDMDLIEVHWELASLPAYLPRLRADDLWRRATPIQFAGQPMRVLAPADELRYLCFHYAAQHQSSRLIWLVDIAELVHTLPEEWEWPAFVDRTITLGLATPVAVSLERAQSLLGLPLPGGVLTDLWRAAAMRREISAWSSASAIFRRPDSLLHHLLVQPRARERLMLLRALAVRAGRRWRRQAVDALTHFGTVLSARTASPDQGASTRRQEDTLSGQLATLSLALDESEPAQQLALDAQAAWSDPHLFYWPLKRFFDIVVSVIALVFLLVILVPISILLFAEDGGPPLYRGEAVGYRGRHFKVYKIRTMHRDAHVYFDQYPEFKAAFLQNYKLADDPRVLRVGGFLRQTSLDELPQAINVLRGDMSWVGPRYVTPEELERYGTFAQLRLCMRPGITGLWQINGRSNLPYPLRVVYDRTYYYTRSLWTDFKIFWRTIPVVLRRTGAV